MSKKQKKISTSLDTIKLRTIVDKVHIVRFHRDGDHSQM